MYQSPCRNCDHVYTGELKRTLKVCMAEHKQAIQKSDPNNGIAVPVAQSHHSIDWAEVQLVRSGQGYWEKRLTMETIQIKRSEGLCFPSVWNPGSTKLNHPATFTLAIIISALLGPCHARMIASVKSITYSIINSLLIAIITHTSQLITSVLNHNQRQVAFVTSSFLTIHSIYM